MPPRGRKTTGDEPVIDPDAIVDSEDTVTPADDPDVFDGDPSEDPALADPDAKGPSPRPGPPVVDEPEDIEVERFSDDPSDEYIVLVDAINIKRGEKTNDVVRLQRGQVVVFSEETRKHTDVAHFVRIKAIAPNNGDAYRRTTARAMTLAAGAADDPVPTPDAKIVQESVPVTPA